MAWLPKASAPGAAASCGAVELVCQVSAKSSMAELGRLPEPVVSAGATTRIQTGPPWLSSAPPKLAVRVVLENACPVVEVVPTCVKALGVVPMP